jgi:hypothetical protein
MVVVPAVMPSPLISVRLDHRARARESHGRPGQQNQLSHVCAPSGSDMEHWNRSRQQFGVIGEKSGYCLAAGTSGTSEIFVSVPEYKLSS